MAAMGVASNLPVDSTAFGDSLLMAALGPPLHALPSCFDSFVVDSCCLQSLKILYISTAECLLTNFSRPNIPNTPKFFQSVHLQNTPSLSTGQISHLSRKLKRTSFRRKMALCWEFNGLKAETLDGVGVQASSSWEAGWRWMPRSTSIPCCWRAGQGLCSTPSTPSPLVRCCANCPRTCARFIVAELLM